MGVLVSYFYMNDQFLDVVRAGLASMVFASFMSFITVWLPPSPSWHGQDAVASVFGQTPRIVAASLFAYFVGEFANSFVLAKMKVATNGKHLWARTIGSTIVGEAVDTLIFFPLAFYGVFEDGLLIRVIVANYVVKVMLEALLTPFTYFVVARLKAVENVDHYDVKTNFTPFTLG